MDNKAIKAIAEGGDFDETVAIKLLAAGLVALAARLDALNPAKPAPNGTLKGRENGASGGTK